MINLIFVGLLGGALGLVLRWAFQHFPDEEWQFLAAVPQARGAGGAWEGINLTWYGALSASAYTFGVILFLVLTGSIAIPRLAACALMAAVLALCVPASRWVARIVENKRHTFTVGGASFVGMVMAPWAIVLLNGILAFLGSQPMPSLAVLSALAVSYAFGEGIGRLACISFGCCYGRSLESSPPFWARTFGNRHFVFHGKTKKIAYASQLDGRAVIPVQALTAVGYIATGLISMGLFLSSFFGASFLLAAGVTQAWRAFSELLRADYRGEQPVSAYQIMAILSIVYAFLARWVLPEADVMPPSIIQGLKALWSPGLLLVLQGLWVSIFLYTGRSTVTGSSISFHVKEDRI
ncbi:MAG: prolipoprotein diacylglyceryl transferase [Syntrophobacteraceae bacterium]|nr:prolipoprotein diacylglyceryl transferase [Syntrophobacteraceae bacterium]